MTVHSHLRATLLACLLLGAGLVAGLVYADSVEAQYVHALAPFDFLQKRQGLQLQRAAFQQSDLMPLYGSSELTIPDPYDASKIFLLYPTGFTVFPVGGDSSSPLIQLQTLAGIGKDLRGKRVVLSLSPDFFIKPDVTQAEYMGNFSRLHALAFVLSDLPTSVKQPVAQRMLKFPASYADDALLGILLQQLAGDSPASGLGYAAVYPMAKLQELALELQDHWETLSWIRDAPWLQPNVARRAQHLNWNMLRSHALAFSKQLSTNNPFGIENGVWNIKWKKLVQDRLTASTDSEFIAQLNTSHLWGDLKLELATLKAYGAEPLLLSMPWHGTYNDARGISAAARQRYYDQVARLGSQAQVTVVTLQQFEYDNYFLLDPGSHLSAEGWVNYSKVLDDFYHDRLSMLQH